ncbi:MAG: Kdo hydroxylase family protein [Caulobacteraceae bacterium]|nr:Kdo hydroxylase family protein [Caulobacteraceae bacterium]
MAHVDDSARTLETAGLVERSDRRFVLTPAEAALVVGTRGDGAAKNVSLGPGGVRGAGEGAPTVALGALMSRFADWSEALLLELAPRYRRALERGRASLRTQAVEGRPASPRKDDRRLHVDAFASQPTGGRRILRVFANINPDGEARVWRVGEPFEAHARRWIGGWRPPLPGLSTMLNTLGVTRARRTPYDWAMLALHDSAKLDETYQASAAYAERRFAAGSSWIVFTDSTVHAAIAGRHALEQTFYLPVAAMAEPNASPLRILERLTGRPLT